TAFIAASAPGFFPASGTLRTDSSPQVIAFFFGSNCASAVAASRNRPARASCSTYVRTGISGVASALASSPNCARLQSSATVISVDHGNAALEDQHRIRVHLHHDALHLHLDLPFDVDHHAFDRHAHLVDHDAALSHLQLD